MAHRNKIIATAAALAVAAVAAAAALAGGSGPARTLTFVARAESNNIAFDDLGAKSPHGPDIGDVIAFTHALLADGKPVGLVHLAAIGVDHKRHLSQAFGTIVLQGGTINISGLVPETPRFTLVVAGGTGSFTGARGTVTISTPGHTSTLIINLAAS